MNIAIIGSTGFVGEATMNTLEIKGKHVIGYHVDDETSATRKQVNECDVAIVCVPTPMNSNGSCNLSILREVMGWLNTEIIIIKSTVPVGTTRMLAGSGKKVIHMPEFLREETALDDAINPDFVLVGLLEPLEEYYPLRNLLNEIFNCPIVYTTAERSELTKYAINSFLAYKVGFFNELDKISSALNVKSVTNLMLYDQRIGKSHTSVTKQGGFGGHCFPKDLNALIHMSEDAGYNPKLLKQLWGSNRTYRDEFAGEEFNFYE